MSNKCIETVEEAKEILVKALEKEDLDVLALARDVQLNDDCWCIGTSGVDVKNMDDNSFYDVSVSTTCGVGSDDKFEIESRDTERWSRCVYRIISIKVFEHDDEIDSTTHTVGINTGNNKFNIESGRLIHMPNG